AESFEEFKKYLADHAAIGDESSFAEPFKAVFEDPRFEGLFGILYAQLHPEHPVKLSPDEARKLLLHFRKDLIIGGGVLSSGAAQFVNHHFQSPEGRKRILDVLAHTQDLPPKVAARFVRAIASAGEEMADYWDKRGWYDIHFNLGFMDEVTDLSVNPQSLEIAVRGAVDVVKTADKAFETLEKRHQYAERAKEMPEKKAVRVGYASFDKKEFERMVELAKDDPTRAGPLAWTIHDLAQVWLFAADDYNWSESFTKTKDLPAVERARMYLLKNSSELISKAKKTKTDGEMKALHAAITRFLDNPMKDVIQLHDQITDFAVGTDIRAFLEKMPSNVRQPVDTLAQLMSQLEYAWDMGDQVHTSQEDIQIQDEKLKGPVGSFIGALGRTKLELWEGYKRHVFASRAGSHLRKNVADEGNIADIQAAIAEMNTSILTFQNAKTAEELDQEIHRLYGLLSEGGVLRQALIASDNDGIEQSIGLLQTSAEIILASLATGGLATAGVVVRAAKTGNDIRKAVQVARAARAAKAAQQTSRVVSAGKGFGSGFAISGGEAAIADFSGQAHDGPDTLWARFKQATATGLSMAVTGFLGLSQSDQSNILQRLYDRYSRIHKLGKNVILDGALETVEESVDDLLNKIFSGKRADMSYDQFVEITKISFANFHKAGTTIEALGAKRQHGSTKPGQGNPLYPIRLAGLEASDHQLSTTGEIKVEKEGASFEVIQEGEKGPYVLHDLGSLGGVKVNGKRIQLKQTIKQGDAIEVGKQKWIFGVEAFNLQGILSEADITFLYANGFTKGERPYEILRTILMDNPALARSNPALIQKLVAYSTRKGQPKEYQIELRDLLAKVGLKIPQALPRVPGTESLLVEN
ncbi:MAG: FHA domain-containing protein, partial [Deltaproteobacteria bacterium]|nr:FHA domain-containing protein [Deltaproteobacteria bacterium]